MRLNKAYVYAAAVLLLFGGFPAAGSQVDQDKDLPVATQLLFESLGTTGSQGPRSVFKVLCGNGKGTGFALDTGYMITNAHVVEGCKAGDLTVVSATGKTLPVTDLVVDDDRDLAAARLTNFTGGLKIDLGSKRVRTMVSTWGHPLSYDGPPPLATVGWIAGFAFEPAPPTPTKNKTKPIKQLILNAAINPGNSGGPLMTLEDDAVIGVIVSKNSPITLQAKSAIDALSQNKSGFVFQASDGQGHSSNVSEAQVIAMALQDFWHMSQVVIGQAIHPSELVAFLNEHKIPWSEKKQKPPIQTKK
jgi:S1-C subfamily serine protease